MSDCVLRISGYWLFCLVALLAPLHALDAAERRYSTGNFDAVTIQGDFDIVIEQAKTASVRASGDAIALGRVSVRSSGRNLNITVFGAYTPPSLFDDETQDAERITLYIAAPIIKAVTFTGTGSISVAELSGRDTSLILNGQIEAQVADVVSDTLVSSVNGSGSLTIAGDVVNHRSVIRGYGGMDARALQTSRTNIIAQGPIVVSIFADEAADGLANDGALVLVEGTEDCAIRTPSESAVFPNGIAAAEVQCALEFPDDDDEAESDVTEESDVAG